MMIGIYARQSVEKKDSVSIETQIQLCKNLIENPSEKIEVYKDEGYSGKNILRPDFERMMADVRDGKLSKIIVYRLDRFSRNILDFYTVWKILEDNKTEFISSQEKFDTSTPSGKALIGVLVVFAQMERETIQARVKDNYYSRVEKKGTWPGGPAPYGFKNGKNSTGQKTLIHNDKEMEAVWNAFQWYAESRNASLGDIRRWLEEKGYKSRKRDTFDSSTISRMLQNPIYVNADESLYNYFKSRQANILNPIEDWDGTTSCHVIGKRVGNSNIRSYTSLKEQSVYLTNFEGVIDSSTYIKVQSRLAQNQQLKRSNKVGNLKELSGLIKCGKCGYAIKMYSKPYLACYGRYGLRLCDVSFKGKGVKFEEIRKRILEEVQLKIKDLETLYDKQEISYFELAEEKREKEKELSRLLEIATKSPTLSDLVVKQMEETQSNITDIYVEMERLKSDYEMYNIGLMKMAFANINLIDDNVVEFNQSLVRKLIKQIDLHEDGNLTIHWKL